MGHLCYGAGGTIIPPDFGQGANAPDLYLDWSQDYPGSEPPPVTQVPPGDLPNLGDMPDQRTNLDEWAAPILEEALYGQTFVPPDKTALQAIQAISRFESNYGWPFFPTGISRTTGRDGRNWWGHHNWGASLCTAQVGGQEVLCYHNGGCISGFYDLGRAVDGGAWVQYPACFAHYPTNEMGAAALVRRILGSTPSRVLRILGDGDLSLIATDLRARGVLSRTRGSEDIDIYQDASWYVARLLVHARQIAHLYGGMRLKAGSLGADPVVDPSEPPGLSDLPAPPARMGWGGIVAGLAIGAGIGVGGVWAVRRLRGRDGSDDRRG